MNRATQPQVEFIEALAIDLSMDRIKRNKWISSFLGKEVKFVDTLSREEGRRVIQRMLEMKGSLKERKETAC